MSKPQRRSINDALAEISTQASDHMGRDHVGRDHVTTDHVGRDNGAPDDVSRGRIDLPAGTVVLAPVGHDHASRDNVGRDHGGRDHVGRDHVPVVHGSTDEDGYRIRIRREKPHVSLYAHPRVLNAIRDLAIAQRRKPHDLYVEGMRLMLAQYGLDFDDLDGRRSA